MREARPVGRHEVVGLDGPEGDDVLVGPAVPHHADGLDRQEHGEGLADLPFQPGGPELFEEDRVGLAEDVEPLAGHLAQAAHRQAGAGERVAPDQSSGRPSSSPSRRTSSLNRSRSGSISSKPELGGQPADVVVVLDRGGRAVGRAAALDHVGIERALGEEAGVRDRLRLVAEHVDERVADPHPLFLRVADAFEACRGSVARRRPREARRRNASPNASATEVALAFAEQAVVDEDAGHPAADRPGQQRGRDGRIDAAREAADHPVVSPTCRRISATERSRNCPIVHDPGLLQIGSRKLPRIVAPYGVWATSGWNWRPKIGRSRCLTAAIGQVAVSASGDEVVPRGMDLVAVAHPDEGFARDAVQ